MPAHEKHAKAAAAGEITHVAVFVKPSPSLLTTTNGNRRSTELAFRNVKLPPEDLTVNVLGDATLSASSLGKTAGTSDGSAAGGSPCHAGLRRRPGLAIGAEAVRSMLTGLDSRGNGRKATWKAAGARRPLGMTTIYAHQTARVDAQRTLGSTLMRPNWHRE
jgi:hypothetical protein